MPFEPSQKILWSNVTKKCIHIFLICRTFCKTNSNQGAAGYGSICNPTVGLGQLGASVISLHQGGPPDSFSTIKGWIDGIISRNFHYVSNYVFCYLSWASSYILKVNINIFQHNRTRLYTVWGYVSLLLYFLRIGFFNYLSSKSTYRITCFLHRQSVCTDFHGCYNTYYSGFVQTCHINTWDGPWTSFSCSGSTVLCQSSSQSGKNELLYITR